MPQEDMQSENGAGLIRVGRVGVAQGDHAALDDYFNTKDYVCHTPDGDWDYAATSAFFDSMRKALEGYACERHDVLVKGQVIAARTQMSGRFTSPWASPYFGQIEPTGQGVKLELINFFRFDGQGKLVEEWVQYDNLGFMRQLGVELTPLSKG